MKSRIFEHLNELLELAKKRMHRKEINSIYPFIGTNVFFVKNDIDCVNSLVEEWAKENNINLFVVTPFGYEIRNAESHARVKNMSTTYIAPTPEEINKLSQPNTVLFLKELHEMQDKAYRKRLLDFARKFIVADKTKEEGYTFVKNTLFTIGTLVGENLAEILMDAEDSFMLINLDKKED